MIPIPSITKVIKSIRIRRLFTPEGESSPNPPAKNMRWRRPILSLIRRKKAVVAVMTPRPPSWIINSTTPWDANERSFPVSTTISPVTHTAEVAVKRASINPRGRVPAFKTRRSNVPETISERNPNTIFFSMGSEVNVLVLIRQQPPRNDLYRKDYPLPR